MTYQTKPTSSGVYRIKVLDQDLVIESTPGYNPGLKLAAPSNSNNKQKWKLSQVSGQSNVWTMVSVEDQSGVTYIKTENTYWGYGYPDPQPGPSKNWSILERTVDGKTFSKITLSGDSNCFDSCSPGSDAVHFYYDHTHVYDGPKQCYVFELIPDVKSSSALDIIFVQDATGSQQPYINKARDEVTQICTRLLSTGKFAPDDLRFGLVTFRDHSPQDDTMLTKSYPFSSDVGSIVANLASLTATGGGDGPEAQSDALSDAYKADWNDKATKVVVLVTDSPPHGIGEDGDGFPKGCPLQIDPLRVAARMARAGITLDVVVCEPTLSQYYKKARDFYEGLVRKTGGKVYNLGDLSVLTDLLVGAALEAVDSEPLVAKHQVDIRNKANANMSASEISRKLHSDLSAAGVQHNTLFVDNMYEPSEQGDRNAQVWFEAENIDEAKSKIQQIEGNRITEKYRSGASQSATVKKQLINLAQVEAVVQKSLMRGS